METKQLEIRDEGILFSVIAILVGVGNSLRGLVTARGLHQKTILLTKLKTLESQYEPSAWRDTTTMCRAHAFIEKHWNQIADGGVIDVRDIRTQTHQEAA